MWSYAWQKSCFKLPQLAILTGLQHAGVAAASVNSPFDLALGEDLKAQAEASDKKTDNLPTFKDIGKSLGGQLGQNNPKDVGKAVEANTPGLFFEHTSYIPLSQCEKEL